MFINIFPCILLVDIRDGPAFMTIFFALDAAVIIVRGTNILIPLKAYEIFVPHASQCYGKQEL